MSKRTASAAGMGRGVRPAAGLAAVLALGIVASGCGGSGHHSSTASHRVKIVVAAPKTSAPKKKHPAPATTVPATTTPTTTAAIPTTTVPSSTVSVSAPATMWAVTAQVQDSGTVPERIVGVDPATGALSGASFALPDATDLRLVVIAPGDTEAYLVEAPSYPTKTPESYLLPMSLTTGAVGTPIGLSASITFMPTSAAFSPDGSTLYLADAGNGDLLPVDLASGAAEPAIPVGGMAACGDAVTDVAVTPNGQDAYIEALGRFYDVNLATRKSSPAFTYSGIYGSHSFGDPSISLNPAGTDLYALESGESADRLGVIRTAGDSAGPVITVPIAHRENVGPPHGAPHAPNWDKLYVPSSSTALVVAYGTYPESIIPVNLATGATGTAVPVESVTSSSSCGDYPSIPVGITADGSSALVGVPGSAAVRTVNLSSGAIGGSVSIASSGSILAVVSPSGYSDTAEL